MTDARAVIESALNALVSQDVRQHMLWIDDDIRVEPLPSAPLLAGKLRYLEMVSLLLLPGAGARVTGYEITHVGAPGQDIQWIRVTLRIEVAKDGRLFPPEPVEYIDQESDTWYGVRKDRVTQIKSQSKARILQWSSED
jgi:hypothetical protein